MKISAEVTLKDRGLRIEPTGVAKPDFKKALLQAGGNAEAAELGITPDTSMVGGYLMGDETIFHGNYRAWLHLLKRGLEKR